MRQSSSPVLNVAVLISGSGRTLNNFIELSESGQLPIAIRLVVSSNSAAGGLQHAQDAELPTKVVKRSRFDAGAEGDTAYSNEIFSAIRAADVDYVLLAGFIKYLPIPDDFDHRVLNIHPSLIPAFCGPGMYGDRVHQAVLERGAKVTGCTVHLVDNEYDPGPILCQEVVAVEAGDTPESLAARVFAREKEVFPQVLRQLAQGQLCVAGRCAWIELTKDDEPPRSRRQ